MSIKRRFIVPKMPSDLLYLCSGTQVAFHGVNKSGSLAMANVLREAFDYSGRSECLYSHYHIKSTVEDYIKNVNADNFCKDVLISHYLYGALSPRPNRVWVTQLRHPLPRILSCYQWLKNKNERVNGAGSFDSLDVFIEKTRGVMHSQVAQFACNWGGRRSKILKILDPQDMLFLTMDALERDFPLLGIAEFFEESIFMFASLCGLTSIMPWVRDVRNPGRLNSNEIPSTTADLIGEVFKMDFILYDWALSRFRSQLKFFDFESELTKYKIVCMGQYNDRIISS